MTEAGNITVAKKRWQRQQAERRLTINGVQDRQRHKSSIGHRGRHSIDRAAAQVASPADVNREENQREAQNTDPPPNASAIPKDYAPTPAR
jgi:hypothetical protein